MQFNNRCKTISELPEVLKVKDIQSFLGIGRSQAYQLVKSNAFHNVKVGKRILVPKKAFMNWFEGNSLLPNIKKTFHLTGKSLKCFRNICWFLYRKPQAKKEYIPY